MGSPVYYLLALLMISSIYFHALEKKNKRFFVISSGLYLLFGMSNLHFIQKSTINSYTLILMSVMITAFGLYYFYWLMVKLPTAWTIHNVLGIIEALLIIYALCIDLKQSKAKI